MSGKREALVSPTGTLPQKVERAAPPSWNEIGESFETLGKVGLAVAVGFSAAGLFCRLADQGRIRVPSLSTLLLSPRPEGSLKGGRASQATSDCRPL
jgi:hypothetical protein